MQLVVFESAGLVPSRHMSGGKLCFLVAFGFHPFPDCLRQQLPVCGALQTGAPLSLQSLACSGLRRPLLACYAPGLQASLVVALSPLVFGRCKGLAFAVAVLGFGHLDVLLLLQSPSRGCLKAADMCCL